MNSDLVIQLLENYPKEIICMASGAYAKRVTAAFTENTF